MVYVLVAELCKHVKLHPIRMAIFGKKEATSTQNEAKMAALWWDTVLEASTKRDKNTHRSAKTQPDWLPNFFSLPLPPPIFFST